MIGAEKSLALIKSIQIELSTVQLYENQKLFRYFFESLEKEGFDLWGLKPGFSNPVSGQLLQFDRLFHRK